jgi:hypothetical protein
MNVDTAALSPDMRQYIKAVGNDPVFFNEKDGHLAAVLLSADNFRHLVEDKMLGALALQAEQEGYLSVKESTDFLNRYR